MDDRLFKMRRCGFRESFENLRTVVRRDVDYDLEIPTIQKINHLVGGFLVVCQDPLKNIAIGLPTNKASKSQRKKQLRIALYHFAARNSTGWIPYVQEEVPLRPI